MSIAGTRQPEGLAWARTVNTEEAGCPPENGESAGVSEPFGTEVDLL